MLFCHYIYLGPLGTYIFTTSRITRTLNFLKDEVVFPNSSISASFQCHGIGFSTKSTYSNTSNNCRIGVSESSRHPAISKILRCTVLITSEVEYFYDFWYTNHLCLGSSFWYVNSQHSHIFPLSFLVLVFSWNDCLHFLYQSLVSYVLRISTPIYSWLVLALYSFGYLSMNRPS